MSFLDKIVSPKFVAWNAHMWFAAFVVSMADWYVSPLIVVPAALALAALKEFYIDKHFESGQSFRDNSRDFLGYASGVAVGWFAQSKVQDEIVQIVTLLAQQFAAIAAAACHINIK